MKDSDGPKKERAEAMADLKWAMTSESSKHISAGVELAKSEPGIPILPEELDRDPMLLNCPNGTLELRTGTLRDHRREDYITKLCRTGYHPEAGCPLWEKFLGDVFPAPDDKPESQANLELRRFLQRYFGYCLTGLTTEHILAIFWGGGANGKTTLVNTVLHVMGRDYAIKANHSFLMATRGERHPTEQASLFGVRLAVASETEEDARLNEPLIKDLTGGESIRARRMREDFWEFEPTHKLLLQTNHKPRVSGTDTGIWRRLALVPFAVYFWNPDDQAEKAKNLPAALRQDKTLGAKLRGEREGILAWMVRGCLEWQREGLSIPASVSKATKDYRTGEDVIGRFIDECCILSTGTPIRVKAKALYAAYQKWCEEDGEKWSKQKTFGDCMTDKGFKRETSNGTWYLGITLQPEAESDESGGVEEQDERW